MEPVTVAAVQATPVLLDREQSLERACDLIAEAAGNGARLISLPEAFIPGYPEWVWRHTPWSESDLYARMYAQALTVGSAETDRLGEAARLTNAWVAVGISERDAHSETIYNSLLYLAPDGSVAGCHRKLMPTGGEKLVWGSGDGSTLAVFDTEFGRVGGLICWENYMPLARAAMYGLGVDVYLAPTWDAGDSWVATLRHIAKEGRCYVIGTNTFLKGSDIQEAIPEIADKYTPDKIVAPGNAAIVDPGGDIIAGPLVGEAGILYATIDSEAARVSRRQFDAVGHYSRPDVFHLEVDTRPRPPVSYLS
ncbi:MAG TPA: carbon-nitrogen hydrolase family protein [Acidimicrobiales bacterium]|nr:carbon-nitrogen hydrolase family protein [Acidimicrobiales bacterium]